MANFIEKYFEKKDSEFKIWTPIDWIGKPKFIDSIKDKYLSIR